MIAVFAAQDMGHQRRADKAFGNGSAWHLGLDNLVTTGTGQARAIDLIDDVMAAHIFQLFHQIGPQFPEAATAIFAGLTALDGLLHPLEAIGERLAPARCPGWLWGLCG